MEKVLQLVITDEDLDNIELEIEKLSLKADAKDHDGQQEAQAV